MGCPEGLRFLSPSTFFRVWERYNPFSGETTVDKLITFQQIPQTFAQQRPREASPTGKSGIGIATYSQMPQPIQTARKKTVLPQKPNASSGYLQTTAHINPYDALTHQTGSSKLNVKFMG